jgi:hypothetical protein
MLAKCCHLLVTEYLCCCGMLGLGFFHAYDCVSIQWLDRVLEAMGFWVVLRHSVTILHHQALACFMLHSMSP